MQLTEFMPVNNRCDNFFVAAVSLTQLGVDRLAFERGGMGDLLQALMFVTCTRSILRGWGGRVCHAFFRLTERVRIFFCCMNFFFGTNTTAYL